MLVEKELALEEQFETECQVIEMRYEYPRYTGTEKYGIITKLSADELSDKYGELLGQYKPYIWLSSDFGAIRQKYRRNENKHHMRLSRGNIFSIDDEFEEHHFEYAVDDCADTALAEIQNEKLWEGINSLDEKQRRRLIAYFVDGKTYREIAELEGVDHKAVLRSVEAALRKLKKILI